ncbi:multicopy suppressor of a budding defect [Exophiala oligosperma]
MPFFSKVFKGKDGAVKKSTAPVANGHTDKKPQWSDAWIRTRVDPEEVSELLHLCTAELKSRALDVPFLLLPFRPSSDPSAARTFVRNFFLPPQDREQLRGPMLENELRMTEVMVLISVMKWCWARLPGGVVTWEVYEGFRVGEKDSGYTRDAFTTFIPLGADSSARGQIIQDYFDLLAATAAHGKANGLGGHKLSRYAGWWAFEHYDSGKGFETGYKSWAR